MCSLFQMRKLKEFSFLREKAFNRRSKANRGVKKKMRENNKKRRLQWWRVFSIVDISRTGYYEINP